MEEQALCREYTLYKYMSELIGSKLLQNVQSPCPVILHLTWWIVHKVKFNRENRWIEKGKDAERNINYKMQINGRSPA